MAAVPLTSTVTVTPGAATGTTLSAIANGNNATASLSGSTGVALVPISQFGPASGILLAARVTASVPVSVTTFVTGVVPANGPNRTITSTATYTGAITAPGITIAGTPLVATKGCSGGNCANSPNNQTAVTTGTIAGTASVAPGSLASYYGVGSVSVATAGTLNAAVANGSNVTSGKGDAIVSRTAESSYAIAYDYLNFSQPSFSGSSAQNTLSLDFGTRALNSGQVTLTFTLYNIGNANSAGFDLLAVGRDTGNPLFTSTLAPFTNSVAGGASRSFSMIFDPSTLGSQFDAFQLRLRDSAADVGTGIGAREYDLVLNVAGLVNLPEPGTWVMMIAGFGLIGVSMRRRRTVAAA